MLCVRDTATDCVLPTMLLRLPQTFGTKWDAAILWLYEKNHIIVFILIKKKNQEHFGRRIFSLLYRHEQPVFE